MQASPPGSPTAASPRAAACRSRTAHRRPARQRARKAAFDAFGSSRAARSDPRASARGIRLRRTPDGRSSPDTRAPRDPSGCRRSGRWVGRVPRPRRRAGTARASVRAMAHSRTLSGSPSSAERAVFVLVLVLDLGLELRDLEQEAVLVRVVADRELAGAEERLDRVLELRRRSRPAPVSTGRSARSLQHQTAPAARPAPSPTTTVTRSPPGRRLQVERPHPRLADRVGRDHVDGAEVHGGYPRTFVREPSLPGGLPRRRGRRAEAIEAAGVVHEQHAAPGGRRRRPPRPTRRRSRSVGTHRAACRRNGRARSGRCRRAVATATRPRRCRRAIRSTSATARACASTNASPAGEAERRRRLLDGLSTASSAAAAGGCLPVHEPASISIRSGVGSDAAGVASRRGARRSARSAPGGSSRSR